MSSKWWLVAAASGVLALGVAACGDDDDDDGGSSSGGGEVSGTINIDGSSTVFPFTQRAAELFNEENPDVSINVGQSGTGGGFEKFCAGETDISDASRPIEEEEIALCEKNGIAYEELQVASDGIAVVTNPALGGQLPLDGAAQAALEQGLDGRQPERARRGRRLGRAAARRRAEPGRPRYRLRHVRLLHRDGQR